MSVILEALRKSEAERQRGRAPGLFVEQAVLRTRRSGWSRAWPWGLAAVLVAVLAAWGWREWARSGPTVVVVQSAPAPVAVPAPAPVQLAPAAPQPGQDLPALTLPGPGDAGAPGRGDTLAENLPAPTVPAADETPVAPAMPSVTPAESPVSAVAPVAEPAIATPAPSEPAPAATESLPTVASLGASERAQLPPLKLSMHVYADVPAQRFVILDGQRLAEGASPAPGLVLEQIRRDGLVLSVNGQRLLLARP